MDPADYVLSYAKVDLQKITTWSTFQNIFSLIVRVITTTILTAGVIVLAVHEPNLRSWGCENKYLETDINDNVIGFEEACLELVRILDILSGTSCSMVC